MLGFYGKRKTDFQRITQNLYLITNLLNLKEIELHTYILTGGNSTRMETDKAMQLYCNKAFINHILTAVKPICKSITLVSSKQAHQNLGVEVVPDLEINKGPVCGIAAALKHSVKELNLILSCDTPLIKTSFLEWLIANHNNNYDATVGFIGDKKMPLTALYHKKCGTKFTTFLQKNQLKVMNVLTDLNIHYLEIPKQYHRQLSNINTVQQLKAISV